MKNKIPIITISIVIITILTIRPTKVSSYSDELINAYYWAYENWITTQPTIEKANMKWKITRAEMAKMISNYAKNILGKIPDTSKSCSFLDSNLAPNLIQSITESCQLWLMWQWVQNFRPNDKITRAEFSALLSRLLYWNKYEWWTPYYLNHMKALQKDWIMNEKSDPLMDEIRWYIMNMLYKSSKLNTETNDTNDINNTHDRIDKNIITVNYETWYTKLNGKESYYNEFYWLQINHTGEYQRIISISSWELTYYSFIPKKYWDYELNNDEYYLNKYRENAKLFNDTWFVIFVESFYLIKEWSKKYLEREERYEGNRTPVPTNKWYVIEQEPWMAIQESPYNYIGKKENIEENYWNVFHDIIGKYEII